jgi:hypothetical protein
VGLQRNHDANMPLILRCLQQAQQVPAPHARSQKLADRRFPPEHTNLPSIHGAADRFVSEFLSMLHRQPCKEDAARWSTT